MADRLGVRARRLFVAGLVAVLGSLSAHALSPTQGGTADETYWRVALDEPELRWIGSGAWDSMGDTISLVDVASATILRYRFDGLFLEAVKRPGLGRYEFNHPATIQAAGGGYIVDDYGGSGIHWIWFDEGFRPTRALDIRGDLLVPSEIDGATVERVHLGSGWAIVDGSLVGYGRVIFRGGGSEQGWLALDEISGEVRSFRSADLGEAHYDAASLIGSSIASAGDYLYLLHRGDPVHIRRVFPGGPKELTAFPDGFRVPPALPHSSGPESDRARYQALTEARMAARLYSQGGFLYLLTRQPEGSVTGWRVHQIDPREDRLVRTVRLPTTAEHVMLVPGPKHWAVVEKGPVIASGRQEVEGWWLVATAWLEDPKSGTSGAEIACN